MIQNVSNGTVKSKNVACKTDQVANNKSEKTKVEKKIIL